MASYIKKIVSSINAYKEYKKELPYIQGISFSQNFEDLIFQRIIETNKSGFYVDVGAHDPIRFSNTYSLNKRGWTGINIDPLPECYNRFCKERPQDINLNIGIAEKPGTMTYFAFEEPAYNTFSAERADKIIENKYSKLISKKSIEVDTLERCFDKYVNNRHIDLLTIDVETMELEVLKTNNWNKYLPSNIIMEAISCADEDLRSVYHEESVGFLLDKGYIVVAKVKNAVFLKKN